VLPTPTLHGRTKRSAETSCVEPAPTLFLRIRKWTLALVPNHIPNGSKRNTSQPKKPTRTTRYITVSMEYEANIFAFVDECDRRIRAAHRRLEKTPEENAKTTNLMREIAEIELAIQGGTEKIETLGEQGKVEESMREMAAIEALKSEKADKERELQQLTDTSGASGHQKLRVCDVCGAYLSVLDSDRRLADHFGGKMHLGYHELRNMLSKFKEEREKRKMAPPSSIPSGGSGAASASGPPRSGGDYRSSRGGDDYRERGDRDRGYERQSSRFDDRRRDRERSRSPGRRRY